MVDYKRGKNVSTRINVPFHIAALKNIDDPETQKALALPSRDE
jgi:hypothetical protein